MVDQSWDIWFLSAVASFLRTIISQEIARLGCRLLKDLVEPMTIPVRMGVKYGKYELVLEMFPVTFLLIGISIGSQVFIITACLEAGTL